MLNEKAEKEKEIERVKNAELKEVYAVIEEQIKSITDSINYAQRIQMGILPSKKVLTSALKDYFVFYQPKDIVSGDFYWCDSVFSSLHHSELSLIAAVDCTGHGVPGAFMSMLAYNLLNQALKESQVNYPSDVLNFLKSELPKILKAQNQEESIRDGMDMALCVFDWFNSKLYFSGAHRPLWIIRKGKNELEEIKATWTGISGLIEDGRPFVNHEIHLNKGDTFYIFTDGYADQFNGQTGKKLTTKKFKNLLLEIQEWSMNEQATYLKNYTMGWRGAQQQIDDILVIGIRV